MAKAEAKISWLPMRVIAGRVARHLGCSPEDARLRIVEEWEGRRIRACGLTVEGWPMSPLPATWRGIDWDAGPLLSCDDLIAADLLPGRSEKRSGWWAAQTLAWIIGRELEWTPEMGKEITSAQLKLSEAIAARRINLWGRQPGSLQIKPISNDLFSPSKYKVVVTGHGDLSTEPPRKRHEFEEEYKDDSKWHDIIFAEDEIRREWLPGGRAASAHEPKQPASERATAPSDKKLNRFVAGFIKDTTTAGRTPTKAGLWQKARNALPGATRGRLLAEFERRANTLPRGRPRKNHR